MSPFRYNGGFCSFFHLEWSICLAWIAGGELNQPRDFIPIQVSAISPGESENVFYVNTCPGVRVVIRPSAIFNSSRLWEKKIVIKIKCL